MASHITTIDKHAFVCGLFWQSLSKPRELAREASELGRKIDADLMVIRIDHTTAQAGFAHSKEGVRRGMFSLAALVSRTMAIDGAVYDGEQQPVHNWLGAFKLPDGQWAYFAVRDANFLPNGDFCGSKEEVLDRLHNDYAMGGWNVILGEEELRSSGFHNFQARAIRSFIPQRADGSLRIHRWWGLRQIGGYPAWLPMAGVCAGLAVLALAGGYGWKYYQQRRAAAEAELAMQQVRERLRREASVAARPWARRTTPLALVRACQHGFTHPTAGGWQLDSYTCTQERQVYAWKRGDSSIAMLREQLPDVQMDPSGERADYVRQLALPSGRNEDLVDSRDAMEPVLSRLQTIGVPIKVAPAPAPAPAAAPQGGEPQWQPTWRSFLFKLSTAGLEPLEVAGILDRPGIRVDKVMYQGSEWTMEGTIYAK